MYDIASNLSFLYSERIIHRSINQSPFFLDDIFTLKKGDFVLSTQFSISDSLTHKSLTGIRATPIYSAPEVLKSNENSKASDVYFFSIIFYEVMTN